MKRWTERTIPLPFALASLGAAVAAFIAGIYTARATPGGASRAELSFTGVLQRDGQPMAGDQKLVFTFTKSDGATCSPPEQTVTVNSDGTFVAPIPIDTCPALFDGADVTLAVAVNGQDVAQGPVDAVPYAKYADHAGSPDCPAGYARAGTARTPSTPIICTKGADEVVKIGAGATAFWMDRYEASMWSDPAGTMIEYGAGQSFPSGFPPNGSNWSTPVYAVSKAGVLPSAGVTWFQASLACRLSGKRLPAGDEWLLAGGGTIDGSGAGCNTGASDRRPTGLGMNCVSVWGVEDMVGNLWEWTAEWYAGLGREADMTFGAQATWPGTDYGGDGTYNIASSAAFAAGMAQPGLPAAALRGGDWNNGALTGLFALDVKEAPTLTGANIGFRCLLPR